jgi:uncharacterized protein YqgQ
MNKPNSPDYGKHLLVRGVYFTSRPKIKRENISEFVNMLHEVQQEYLEEAVQKSGYKEANEVIKQIMEKK